MKIGSQGALRVLKSVACLALALAAYAVPAAAAGDKLPSSRDALFDDDEAPAKDTNAAAGKEAGGKENGGKDSDLGASKAKGAAPGIRGYVQFEMARTTGEPEHWSKMRTRADVSSQGSLGEGLKWKLGARLDYDAVYDSTDFYPSEVARNQRWNAMLRENYLDYSAGDWDFRLGRQHVVWGEMVGLFFADVVSARDMREFILPEFEAMRIPQWAARAEYFKNDFHAELLWIPVASYDQIGKPGAEFYPYQPVPPGAVSIYRSEQRPARNADHMNYGLRLSTLNNGWDVSGFYYRSMDNQATFYREYVAPATFVFQARHDRINQFGGTVAKDFGPVVFKSEAVYTRGRRFAVLRLSEADGVVPQETVDWAAGLDFTGLEDTRFNVQFFQRVYLDHDPGIIQDKRENGYTLYLNRKLTERVEAQALFISSINRPDWLFRPKISWNFERNWRLLFGADIFRGPPQGAFGQYDHKDRVYSEIRYSF